MKKIILTLIFIFPLTTIFAQDDSKQVWRVWYMTAKDGKVKQLEKGLADHTEKFHPTDGWPEYFFDVISNGVRNMPGYSHQIEVEDRWAIVTYLKALRLTRENK